MEYHLLMLYVTVEQETAIRNLFKIGAWDLKTTDLQTVRWTNRQAGVCECVPCSKCGGQEVHKIKDEIADSLAEQFNGPTISGPCGTKLENNNFVLPDTDDHHPNTPHSIVKVIIQSNNTEQTAQINNTAFIHKLPLTAQTVTTDGGIDTEWVNNGEKTTLEANKHLVSFKHLNNVQNPSVISNNESCTSLNVDNEDNDEEEYNEQKVQKMEEKKTNTTHKQRKRKPRPSKKKLIFCEDCKMTFTSDVRYRKHKERNGGKCVFECPYCDKVILYRKSRFDLHIRSAHTKERPFVCEICNKGFVAKEKLNIHKRYHTGIKDFVCEHCGKGFYSRGDLAIHISYHHVSQNKKDQFYCKECNSTYCSKRYLEYHKKVTHGTRRDYNCNVCGKIFKTYNSLKSHMVHVHTEERPFSCESCEKAYKTRSCLKKHMLTHTGERRCICDECGKGFYSKIDLGRHTMTHTGEKPFSCDECDFKCKLKGGVKKHKINMHTKK